MHVIGLAKVSAEYYQFLQLTIFDIGKRRMRLYVEGYLPQGTVWCG